MRHRTQLYLEPDQYRWLRRQAGERGSIAAVVRELIDGARNKGAETTSDPLIRYLCEDEPAEGAAQTSVTTLDRDIYGP